MNNPTYTRECPSIYRGVVESNKDPKNLGRCKIRVPSVHGALTYPSDILPWARPVVLSPVSKDRGSVNIPDVGDIVWVLFEGANKDFPIYIGGTYATGEIEIDIDRVDFYIEDDNKVSYDRKTNKYSIEMKNTKIIVSQDSIELIGDVSISGNLSVSGTINGE